MYGGSDRISYKITADYYDQEGIIKYNNDYKRLNIRSQLEVDVNKYIKAGITGYMQRTWRNNGGWRRKLPVGCRDVSINTHLYS